MSFDALSWAAKRQCGSSGAKLVLLGLAECASRKDALAYPSIAELIEFSSLNRKSIIANLGKLEQLGLIQATGDKVGRTKQIKVYRLCLETVPKTEQSQIRNSTVISTKSPKNGTRNKSEQVSSEPKGSSPRANFPAPQDVPDQVWLDFMQSPKRRKAGMSATAYSGICNNLYHLAEHGFPPGEMIALAVERGWTTVKLEWVQNDQRKLGHERSNNPLQDAVGRILGKC